MSEWKVEISGFADEIASDLNQQIALLQDLDMHYLEMRGVNGRFLVEYTLEEAAEIKKTLDAAGIRLSSVGSPIGKIRITDDFEPHFELLRHTVELAHLMETPNIRMFSFFMPQGEDPARYHDEVMRRLDRMAQYAAQHNVVLLHENEKEIYGDIAPRCLEIMQELYSDSFKAVFDFANFVQCGQDTWEAWEVMRPYVSYVHIKDALFATGGVVPAGEGDGQVKRILGELKKQGYQGFLSLEPHLAEFDGFAALEYGGSIQNSGTPREYAFRIAHKALMRILADL